MDANKWPSSISDVVANYQLLCNSFSTENSSVRVDCEGSTLCRVGWMDGSHPSENPGNFQVLILEIIETKGEVS